MGHDNEKLTAAALDLFKILEIDFSLSRLYCVVCALEQYANSILYEEK